MTNLPPEIENITSQKHTVAPNLLLVDDKKENLKALETILATVDAKLHIASSGNEALSLMLRHKFALVLTDVQMPEMDGFEFVSLMRKNPETVYTPVIFVTANSMEYHDIQQGYDVGAIDYLLKPVDRNILLAKVSALLDIQKQINELEQAIYHYKQFIKHYQKYNGDIKFDDVEIFDDKKEQDVVPKVLVVDDRKENLVSMQTVLKKLPVEIITTEFPEQALELVNSTSFSLILLDVQMPRMDGFEVAEKIRQMQRAYVVPIIFVTAISTEQRHVFKGYESGAIDYIFKPVNPLVLKSKVEIFTQIARNQIKLKQLLHKKNGLLYKVQKLNAQLGYLAYHDPLTMCSNRAGFEQNLTKALENALRYRRKFAVLFIDLDRFKLVNDVYGHDYGDKILQEVAKRLQTVIRKTDHVARIGGDEFAIVLEEIKNFHGAGVVAQNLISRLSEPYMIKNKELKIGISIGIACYPSDNQHKKVHKVDVKSETETVVKNADAAMFKAKKQKNNAYEFYTENFSQQHYQRLTLENNLKFALERDELFLVYQPKIDMAKKQIVGVEALVRWQSEDQLISPGLFIPIAEETQMIIAIGKWVIKKAFEDINRWQEQFNYKINMAINISPNQLMDQKFVEYIANMIQQHDVDSNLIELELTETAVMEDVEEIQALLKNLHQLGFVISIDDFGTGYSMLSYLKKLPVHSLKIDIEFIRDLGNSQSSETIVKAIIDLAKNFNLQVIAEGVEDTQQEAFLLANGCSVAQGYLYSKPLTFDQLCQFVTRDLKPDT
ncbi:EAL domain-containing protein [Thiotrichales bacterium 19X7-9]|nr:EAL domain-containing protein [Thiotrichales bacterium 19X7-9]